MKHWMIFAGGCISLALSFSSAFAADEPGRSAKITQTGDVSVRTAYELRVNGSKKKEILELIEKKINENREILKQGACEEVKLKRGKGLPLISIGCDSPNARTDDFFRSLLLDASTENCGGSLALRTYSLALSSTCTLDYCCGVTQAESCKKINRTKPCTVCPTY